MICENIIFFGNGTIKALFKNDEPNKIYFKEIKKELPSKYNKIKFVIIFDDLKAPLEVVKSLEYAQTLNNNRVSFGEIIFDFSNDKTGYSWDIVKSWFKNVAKRMAYSIGMNKNDFSKLYFEVVGV